MEKIDTFLLDRFQKFSDYFQIVTGNTNFTLARICLAVMINCFILRQLVDAYRIEHLSDVVNIFVMVIANIIIYTILYLLIKIAETKCLESPETKNPFEIARFIRLFILIFTVSICIIGVIKQMQMVSVNNMNDWKLEIMTFRTVVRLVDSIFYIMFAYFVSCTPKPKQKSKIKKAIEKLAKLIASQPSLVPVVHTSSEVFILIFFEKQGWGYARTCVFYKFM